MNPQDLPRELTHEATADELIAAVRAVAESVTYQNTAPPAGTTDRSLNYRLTDGDGNASVVWLYQDLLDENTRWFLHGYFA